MEILDHSKLVHMAYISCGEIVWMFKILLLAYFDTYEIVKYDLV